MVKHFTLMIGVQNLDWKSTLINQLTRRFKTSVKCLFDVEEKSSLNGLPEFLATANICRDSAGDGILKFEGEPAGTKKAAEKIAAYRAYAALEARGWELGPVARLTSALWTDESDVNVPASSSSSSSSSIATSRRYQRPNFRTDDIVSVLCRKCNRSFATAQDLFFFKRDREGNDVQLALKAESFEKFKREGKLSIVPGKGDGGGLAKIGSYLTCVVCKTKLGIHASQGDDLPELSAFGGEKVCFVTASGATLMPPNGALKFKWSKALKTDPQFLSISDTYEYKTTGSVQYPVAPEPIVRMVYPTANAACLRYEGIVVTDKQPRREQIEGFRRALLRDYVIVLPTGRGKTLIASMIMKRFRELNPRRLVLLVVDRVPLVEQQKKAIEHETGLIVGTLSSQTNAAEHKLSLRSGAIHALVATAGALADLLQERNARFGVTMNMFSCIIFDECHHVVGDHAYVKLVELVEEQCSQGTAGRPRMVGLSASPTKAKSYEEACDGLALLREKLGRGVLGWYKPRLDAMADKPFEDIEWVLVEDTSQQSAQERAIQAELKELMRDLPLSSDTDGLEALNSVGGLNADTTGRLRGLARMVANTSKYHVNKIKADRVFSLLDAFELNELLGPYAATHHLQAGEAVAIDHKVASTDERLSKQLLELEKRLQELEERTKDTEGRLKAIVFVDTRNAARHLTDRLKVTFPALHPDLVVGQHTEGIKMTLSRQTLTLTKFRASGCRLIVSTSVLEEGLDVQGCNAVFRMGGRASLIQMIQSRGRARAKEGKLCVIIKPAAYYRAWQLRDEQEFLEAALKVETDLDRSIMTDPAVEAEILRGLSDVREAGDDEGGDGVLDDDDDDDGDDDDDDDMEYLYGGQDEVGDEGVDTTLGCGKQASY